ncbi:MAG: transposase [bacterium]|nr:transposase [bacterium]
MLDEAERLGIKISDKRNADATGLEANVDLKRCAKAKRDKNDKTYIDRNTSDPEAEFGRKESNGQGWYGYKSHANDDAETELVTAVITTGANRTDESQLIPLAGKERDHRGQDAIRKQGGDKGYVGHADELEKRNILDYTIPRNNMRTVKIKKDKNKHYLHLRNLRYKVEQKFAEVKNRHGLGKAKHRGKWRVHLRSLLIYLTVNLKRIVNLLIPKTV